MGLRRVVLLCQWITVHSCAALASFDFLPATEPSIVIDLRSRADFKSRHLTGSASLPANELRERMFELPPPQEWPLTLIGSTADLAAAREVLHPRGWRFEERDTCEPSFWCDQYAAAGESELQTWRPNAFLAHVVRELKHTAEGGLALDIGCGSGRDAVFLAQELGDNWDVVGIDNHVAALDRARALAASCGDAATASFEAVDVRKESLDELVASRPVRFVHGCRFLDRALLATLPTTIAPGGIFVWSTFMNGDSPAQAPPFRPSRRLDRGELRGLLGADAGFEVLADVEGRLLTRNVWETAQFYAARRMPKVDA